MRFVTTLACLAVVACPWIYADPGRLPIYIEENHAGSFRGFARIAELDEPHTLILVDAHSDASAVEHSDEVREGIRRVRSNAERERRIDEWRRNGRIQAYNWIEPLMPRPIERVIWIAGTELSLQEKKHLETEARDAVDGRTGIEARQVGELAARWRTTDISEFESMRIESGPVLATFDLDFFSGMEEPEAQKHFRRIWERVLQFPDLRGVTFAISRPWLKDDAEAFRLLRLALNEVRLVRGAEVMFEPFAQAGADDSLKARKLANQGESIPIFKLEDSPADLRAFIANYGSSYKVEVNANRWSELLSKYLEEQEWRIALPLSLDGIHRVNAGEVPSIRVESKLGKSAGRVRWWVLRAASDCYNVMPKLDLGKGFALDAVPWVRENRVFIAETNDGALASDSWKHELDPATGWGRVRIEADVETEQGWIPAPAVEIRSCVGSGFRCGLSEQFGMPYVFGIGFVDDGEVDGPDSSWGNDCTNFLVYAWRRAGIPMRWANPAQLRTRLETITERASVADDIPITPTQIEKGLVIDFGNHVAAVWKDVEPFGVLNREDEMVHHLGRVPEKTTLGKLTESRRQFAVRTLPLQRTTKVAICGDIVLRGVTQPDLPRLSQSSDIVVGNLEGVPSKHPVPGKKYNFAFDPEYLPWFASAGFHAVSLANNHSADAGVEQLPNAVECIAQHNLNCFGAGENTELALRPWRVERNGIKFAFFGVSYFPESAADISKPGVASLAIHSAELAKEIADAKSAGEKVIVLVHWGIEYSAEVNEEQIKWGRWLVDHGADVVAGSHPHVVQPLDFWKGKPVAFSLGNAVYPLALKGADSGAWLDLEFGNDGGIVSVFLRK